MNDVSITLSCLKENPDVSTYLVASNLLSNMVQSLDDAQTQLLALLILCNGDVLDMSNLTQAVNAVVHHVSIIARIDSLAVATHNFFSTIRAPVPTILLSPFRMTKVW